MNGKTKTRFRKILLSEKQRIMNNSKENLKVEVNISQDDLADETDLAATEINRNLAFSLHDRERVVLGKIDEALDRLEDNSFGECLRCDEPIGVRRLEARPFAVHCIACAEEHEHRNRIYA